MAPAPLGPILRLDAATRRKATRFSHDFGADARARITQDLGILALDQLQIKGQLVPEGHDDWLLDAHVSARAVQECVVTLDPVPSQVDEDITRRYLAHVTPSPPGESEVPEDDIEEIPRALDLGQIAREAVALALPPWPRAPGVDEDEWHAIPPGATQDEPRRPFAGLDALRGKLPASDPDSPADASAPREKPSTGRKKKS